MTNTTIAKIVLTAAIALGVVGFFWHSSSSHTGAYKMVDEAVAVAPEWQGKEIKVHGWVQAGTIDEQIVGQEMHRTFVLEHKGATILVKNTGPKPDTFRDKAEVVADGKLVALAAVTSAVAPLTTWAVRLLPFRVEMTFPSDPHYGAKTV